MNTSQILTLCLATLAGAACSLHADTTYTYTGNPFAYVGTNNFFGAPVTNISGSFTVAGPLAANTTYDLTGQLLDYSFTDGRFTSDLANEVSSDAWYSGSGPSVNAPWFTVTTDNSGQIVNWDINVLSNGADLITLDQPSAMAGYNPATVDVYDNTDANPSQGYDAYVYHHPGTWAITSAPDGASTATLLAGALVALSAAARRRRALHSI